MTSRLVWTESLDGELASLEAGLAAGGLETQRAGALGHRTAVEEAIVAGTAEWGLVPATPGALTPREGLAPVVLRREEPRDVLIPARGRPGSLTRLPEGARVGLAGARRAGFLRAHRPDLLPVAPWNGGGPREALRGGSVDALVMGQGDARALGLAGDVTEVLDAKEWLPGPAQGGRLLLGRADAVDAVRETLEHPGSRCALAAELSALQSLGLPAEGAFGILAMPHGRSVRLWGMVVSRDGRRVVRADVTGSAADPVTAGRALARLLRERGATSVVEDPS